MPHSTLANAGGIGKAAAPLPRRRPGESRDPPVSFRDMDKWIPAFAGTPVTRYAPLMIVGRLVGWVLLLLGLAVLLRDGLVRLDTGRWVPLAVGDVHGWSGGVPDLLLALWLAPPLIVLGAAMVLVFRRRRLRRGRRGGLSN